MSPQKRMVKSLQKYVDGANALEDEVKAFSDEELRNKAAELRDAAVKILPKGRNIHITREKDSPWTSVAEGKRFISAIDELIPYSAALVREATLRISPALRLRDVQIMCSAALAKGRLTEFFTGEGKTFVALMPLFMYGLFGRGAHLVTVNEYLAKLHGEWAGRILDRLGLTTGVITHDHAYKFVSTEELKKYKKVEDKKEVESSADDGEKAKDSEDLTKKASAVDWSRMNTLQGYNLVKVSKKEAYGCDVTYGTNSEFGFDYLRDNMARRIEEVNQRELFYCIVDEADSIMVDESRTPLIISAPAAESLDMYKKFAQIVARLDDEDVDIEEKERAVTLKEEVVEKVQRMAGVKNLWEDYQASHHLENALKARFLYKKDDQYIIQDGQVMIVDEFTGRVLPGRRWSEGLHQAVEAKENVEIQRRSSTLATVTYQNFFRLYYVLSGMTGTALTEAEEFAKIYNLDVVVIPTHMPVIRKDSTDVIYKTEEAKFKAVVEDIKDRHEKGQPVLVGTTSVEKSEHLSQLLDREGVKHEVLNAKQHEREAKIVAKAGEYGAVTISTNMAGRGTDIRLGATLQNDIAYGNIVFALKRLGVIPGNKGEEYGFEKVKIKVGTKIELEKLQESLKGVQAYIEEGVFPKGVTEPNAKKWFSPLEKVKGKPKLLEDLEFETSEPGKTITIAIKSESMLWDKVKPTNGELETEANLGLHVLGTERHESRRIDNQLRGRSGRQGDPGSSQFYVATQDDLMRIFGGEVIERLLNNMGISDDLPITAGMLAKQIETAQKKVEGYNFDTRKHLVEYDDVMNEQREVFYGRRRKVLAMYKRDTEIREKNEEMGKGEKAKPKEQDADIPEGRFQLRDLMIEKVKAHVQHIISLNAGEKRISDFKTLWKEFNEIVPEEMAKQTVENNYKADFITWMNQLKNDRSTERVSESLLQLVDEAYDYKEGTVGSDTMRKIERWVLLTVMDKHWTEHLDFMSDLRSAIGLRGYGQRDPLTDYKNEAFELFAKMLGNIDENISKRIFRVNVVKQPSSGPVIAGQPGQPQSLPSQGSARTSVYQQLAKQLMTGKGSRTISGVKPQQSSLDRAVNKVAGASRTTERQKNGSNGIDRTSAAKQSSSNKLSASPASVNAVSSTSQKVGRNDLCPCGSGKKYKKCCYPQFG